MNIEEIFRPAEITYEKRIGMMLKNLEDRGFNLYFDERTKIWECMSENSDFSVSGKNKFTVIQDAWRQIMLG